MRTFRLLLSGFCMGTADIIPGVSGGTMALILNIYEELIDAIDAFSEPPFWQAVRRADFRGAWAAINGNFLVAVGSGILLAVFSLAHLLSGLLESYPEHLFGFFFGLILASVFLVGKRIKTWTRKDVVTLLLGTAVAYFVVGFVPVQTPDTWWFLFLCGAIAICAMILPGISGSFLLLILGKYEVVIEAVKTGDMGTLLIFGLGAGLGLLSFAHVLHWLLHHYHDETVAILMGLMLGSLRKIWPWKADPEALELINVLPDPGLRSTLFVMILMIAGVMCVFGLELVSREK